MLITLDYRNRTPISDQICDAIIRLGACGAIAPGEQLPSVRAMAQELAPFRFFPESCPSSLQLNSIALIKEVATCGLHSNLLKLQL